MIIPMKHLAVFVLQSRRRQATADLAALGAVHVTTLANASPEIEALRNEEIRIRQALSALEKAASKGRNKKLRVPAEGIPVKAPIPQGESSDVAVLCTRAITLADDLEKTRALLGEIRDEMANLEIWSEFEPRDLQDLARKGLVLTLVGIHPSDLDSMDAEIPFFLIRKTRTRNWFAAALAGHQPDPRWTTVPWPRQSLGACKAEAERLAGLAGMQQAGLASLMWCRPLLEARLASLAGLTEFSRVEAGMVGEGEIAVVEGYLPAGLVPTAQAWAADRGWGISWRDPLAGEEVPTEFRSRGPARILRPVLDFLGVTPGYHERDISPWFMFFLVIFFSMIIGDAAYGCILLAAGLGLALKARLRGKKVPDLVRLLLVFSGGTILWGAMNGSWFALEGIKDNPVLGKFMVRRLTDPVTSKEAALLVCFILGLIHLNLAHLLRFFKDVMSPPRIHAIAQLGWMLTLNGAFFLVLNLVVDPVRFPVPFVAWWLIAAGMLTVLVFEKQEGDHFFLGILRSLANIITTALAGVSAFADIISYVRLFAVGLAGLAIEQSFNAMALPLLGSSSMAVAGGIFILVMGHSLNLVMGGLSVMVHGIRLNMLEFSSHTGLEWAGSPYRPFKQESGTAPAPLHE